MRGATISLSAASVKQATASLNRRVGALKSPHIRASLTTLAAHLLSPG
jgi:hypothetical protein